MTRPPLLALADALDGVILGPNSMLVGSAVLSATPAGALFLGRRGTARGLRVGNWSDPVEDIAANVRAVLEEVCS